MCFLFFFIEVSYTTLYCGSVTLQQYASLWLLKTSWSDSGGRFNQCKLKLNVLVFIYLNQNNCFTLLSTRIKPSTTGHSHSSTQTFTQVKIEKSICCNRELFFFFTLHQLLRSLAVMSCSNQCFCPMTSFKYKKVYGSWH